MHTSTRARLVRHSLRAVAFAALTGIAVAACGTTGSGGMSGMDHGSTASASAGHGGMPGMDAGDMPTGDGLNAAVSGYTFRPAATSLPAGTAQSYSFQIHGADGKPVTTFTEDQTKLMHFYLIRSDLAGFQHIHPTMAADGTWTAPVAGLQPGSYRAYASFIVKDTTGRQRPLVLGDRLTVPGTAATDPLPAAATTARIDGYTVTLDSGGLTANMTHTVSVAVSRDGKPVADLQPYLDTYAHLTAFHEGDLAFAHLHPQGQAGGDHGGPTLTFAAMLPRTGNWRLFLQFQTGGTLHTATFTLPVG